MKDFRVVQAKAELQISSVAPIRDFRPPAVVILGHRFNLATEIVYNGMEVKEFIIASATRIIARIPENQVGRQLSSLRVYAPVPLAQQDALVELGLRKPCQTVQGIDRLVQNFVLTFLTTPGSDIFNPTSGGGGRALVGKTGSSSDLSAALAQAIDRTRQQILNAQAQNSKIPAAERLLSATLTSVSYDQNTTTAQAVVGLRNVLGASARVSVG